MNKHLNNEGQEYKTGHGEGESTRGKGGSLKGVMEDEFG
jgi:hypothetical protein